MDKPRCQSKFCLNDADHGKFCYKCKRRKQLLTSEATVVFNERKQRAKSRGIDWEITLEEFKQWCFETGYLKLKGVTADAMTIDRKISTIGYTINNIQMITKSENSKKSHKEKRFTKAWPIGTFENDNVHVPF